MQKLGILTFKKEFLDFNFRQLIASYPESIANPMYLKQIKSETAAEDLLNKIKEANPVITAYCERLDF